MKVSSSAVLSKRTFGANSGGSWWRRSTRTEMEQGQAEVLGEVGWEDQSLVGPGTLGSTAEYHGTPVDLDQRPGCWRHSALAL